MGRELTDEARAERLATRDKGRQPAAYARRARSALFRNETDKKPLHPVAAFADTMTSHRPAALAWLDRLGAVPQTSIQTIFDSFLTSRLSPQSRDFALALLDLNRAQLLALR